MAYRPPYHRLTISRTPKWNDKNSGEIERKRKRDLSRQPFGDHLLLCDLAHTLSLTLSHSLTLWVTYDGQEEDIQVLKDECVLCKVHIHYGSLLFKSEPLDI